ncbi:serine aminopeptidase domain-containing protein [Lutibacter sp.]
MRYFIFSLSLLFISCNFSSEKKVKEISTSTIIENQEIPNIYVVKTIIYSKDSLPITADIYEVDNKKPTVLLCHQARFSRGEYKNTALKLLELGYSCIAIDQRSGKEANGVINETALAAEERNLPTNYLDAKQDIEAAIDYMYEMNGQQPIILVGSSYSATLALLIGNKSEKVKAIVAFSPGEYYKSIDIKNSIKNIDKPIFVTSSKKEITALTELVSLIDTTYVTHYKPIVEGIHGSKALWKTTNGNEAYWQAFSSFLKKN